MANTYATLADLAGGYGPAPAVIANVTVGNQQAALDAAADLADSYLSARFAVPLQVAPPALKRAVCAIATWDMLCQKGFNPEGSNGVWETRSERAEAWLARVAAGKAGLPSVNPGTPDVSGDVVVQASADPENDGSFIVAAPSARGW